MVIFSIRFIWSEKKNSISIQIHVLQHMLLKSRRRVSKMNSSPSFDSLKKPTLKWFHKGYLNLLDYHSIPSHLQDNEFITRYYRAHLSMTDSFISILHLHNESGNIWSHLLSLVCFLTFLSLLLLHSKLLDTVVSTHKDLFPVVLYLLGASICFLSSSIFHWFYCGSTKMYAYCAQLDFAGISAIIFTSTFTLSYYALYCHMNWQYFWGSLLFLVNLVGVIGPFFKSWRNARFKLLRTIVYASSAGFILFPLIHASTLENFDLSNMSFLGRYGLVMSISCYFFGALVYVSRVPEKWFPGTFDLYLHSHQIWHLFVFFGALLHLGALLEWVEWRNSFGACTL